MSTSDPRAGEPQIEPPQRSLWPVMAVFAGLWLAVCAFAFVLMMGWLWP